MSLRDKVRSRASLHEECIKICVPFEVADEVCLKCSSEMWVRLEDAEVLEKKLNQIREIVQNHPKIPDFFSGSLKEIEEARWQAVRQCYEYFKKLDKVPEDASK